MLILASQSPRRAELLRAAGFAFEVEATDVDESLSAGEAPEAYVLRLAEAKAASVAEHHPDAAVVGADTTVVIDEQILAKPTDRADAARMLRLLAGRTHEVLTGVAVVRGARRLSRVSSTSVTFLPMTAADIAWYAASGEPDDKAGAYAIQGLASRVVERIDGSYSNVVGLPVALVHRLLKELGWEP